MKVLYALLICAVLLSGCTIYIGTSRYGFSQHSTEAMLYRQPTRPDKLIALARQKAHYTETYAEYDGVFLLSDEVRDNYYKGNETFGYRRHVRLQYIVIDPESKPFTTFSVETDEFETLAEAHISIVSPDDSVQIFSKKDMRSDTSSDKSTVWKLAYPRIGRGSLVEENYVIENTSGDIQWSHDVRLQFGVPCDRIRFTYQCPTDWNIYTKYTELASLPYTSTVDGKDLYTYSADSVPAQPAESYAPYFKETAPYVSIIVRTAGGIRMGYIDKMWQNLATGYSEHLLDKGKLWSSDIKSLTKTLGAQCSTESEKLSAVVTYLQQNIRMGKSEKNDDFKDVLRKKEASPFMITAMAKHMLDELDISNEYILVHSAKDGDFDYNFVSPDEFYIPALYVTIDTTNSIVLPYYKNVPIDVIPEHFQNQKALRLADIENDRFLVTPTARDIDNTTDEKYTLTIDEEGKIKVEEEKTLRGLTACAVRDRLDNMKAEEIVKEMKSILTYTEGDIKLLSHEVINRTNLREPLVIKLSYEIDNLVTVTPDEILFQTAGLLSPASSYEQKVDTAERRNPIKVRHTETLNKNITIIYPQHWYLTTAMLDKKTENIFGSVESIAEVGAGKLTIVQKRVLLKIDAPREKFRDLLQVVGRSSDMAVPTLIFSAHGS